MLRECLGWKSPSLGNIVLPLKLQIMEIRDVDKARIRIVQIVEKVVWIKISKGGKVMYENFKIPLNHYIEEVGTWAS